MIGEVALTTNEYKTAERLKNDYWLYVVFNCGINTANSDCPRPCPARLGAARHRSSITTLVRKAILEASAVMSELSEAV